MRCGIGVCYNDLYGTGATAVIDGRHFMNAITGNDRQCISLFVKSEYYFESYGIYAGISIGFGNIETEF